MLREEFYKTQNGALNKYFTKEAVKKEEDCDLVLDCSFACASKTDNDRSDNDGNEPFTALSSAANSPDFEIRGCESDYFENIYAQRSQETSTIQPVLYVICWLRKFRSG